MKFLFVNWLIFLHLDVEKKKDFEIIESKKLTLENIFPYFIGLIIRCTSNFTNLALHGLFYPQIRGELQELFVSQNSLSRFIRLKMRVP